MTKQKKLVLSLAGAVIFSMRSLPLAAANLNFFKQGESYLLGREDFHGVVLAQYVTLIFLMLSGVLFKRTVERKLRSNDVVIDSKVGLVNFVEVIMEFISGICQEQFHNRSKFMTFLATIFIFVLVSNLVGLVPGFVPLTENFSSNLALGIISFVVYNALGFKENGFGYLKHFSGPVLVLAPLFFVLEVISHCARPLSLAFRLLANIFSDHMLMGVFSQLAPFGVPILFSFFGLLVAVIQSFVFTVLTSVYISMAISHDH